MDRVQRARESRKKYRLLHADRVKEQRRKYALAYRDKIRERERNFRKKLRIRALQTVAENHDGKIECSCCGEKAIEFLAIDHVNRDGNKERKNKNGWRNNHSFYRLVIKTKRKDLRILCHNCNQSLGYNGYCPHKTQIN